MSSIGGLDGHRAQITFDWVDHDSGETHRGRITPVFPFTIEIRTAAYLRPTILALAVGLVATLVGLRQAVGVDPPLAFGGR